MLQADALQQVKSLVPRIDWSTALRVWSMFADFPHTVSVPKAVVATVTEECKGVQFAEAASCDKNCTTEKDIAMTYSKAVTDNSDGNILVGYDDICDNSAVNNNEGKKSAVEKGTCLPSFRATCHRTGSHHCFQSPDAAAHFGGAVHDYFGWNVDLDNYDIEVVLCIEDRDIRIGISLTNHSLHRRHITHFGKTTLRPTIAHGMLRYVCAAQGSLW